MLEKTQHRFSRMALGLKEMKYEDRLKDLGIWSHGKQRSHADLLEVFKMKSGQSAIAFDKLFGVQNQQAMRGHS